MKNPGRTWTGRQRGQFAYNRKQVSWLTGMSEEDLSFFMFNTGVEWISRYACGNIDLAQLIMEEPVMWDWWYNLWQLRDDEHMDLLYTAYGSDQVADWLASGAVDFDEGMLVGPGGEVITDDFDFAVHEIKKCDVMTVYKAMHSDIFIKYTPPYNLMNRTYADMIAKVIKNSQLQNLQKYAESKS